MRRILLQISLLLLWQFTGMPVFSQTVLVKWIRIDSLNSYTNTADSTINSHRVKEGHSKEPDAKVPDATRLLAKKQPPFALTAQFSSQQQAQAYIRELPFLLQSKGYMAASVDSVTALEQITCYYFLGPLYQWKSVKGLDLDNKSLTPSLIQEARRQRLSYWNNRGYPFAKIYWDSLQIDAENFITAVLKEEKGPLYRIDSVYNTGNVRLDNRFLEQWLELPAGSVWNQQKIDGISRKLQELDYLKSTKPYELDLLGSGAAVHTFLDQQQSSRFNGLIGLLPNNQQLNSRKLLLVGEADLLLRNAFGQGETIGLNWQQLQVRSPRMNLLYRHPYFLGTPWGMDLNFDFFRKDSSFINLDFQLGLRYKAGNEREMRIFFQRQVSNLSNGAIDKQTILSSRKLPSCGDLTVTGLGVDLSWNRTDYRLNPRKGSAIFFTGVAGRRTLRRNPDILNLKDPAAPGFDFASLYDSLDARSYQLKCKAALLHYLPLGKTASVLKLALQGGWVQSPQLYRNDLFQLGGFKLLRGFDEQSQYLSGYGVLTSEYRYLAGPNSFFYAFIDAGWGEAREMNQTNSYRYVGTGLGMTFETKAGILNLAWAVGKRSDYDWDFRQSKIHLGLTNYF